MSLQFPNLFRVDINKGPLDVRLCRMFQGDEYANRIGCYLYDGDTEITPDGSVAGEVILPNGATEALSGSVSGNLIYVDLTDVCYAAPGEITVSVTWTNGTATVTALQGHGTVNITQTEGIVGDAPQTVAELILAINTAVASIPSDYSSLLAAIAPNFSANEPYTAGRYVWYSGTLYKFTADHAAGSWTRTDAESAVIGTELYYADKAIRAIPEHDLLLPGKRNNSTYQGVTFAWNADKTECTVNGTASGAGTGNYFLGSATALPDGISAGKTYHVQAKTTSDNAYLGFYLYKDNGVYYSNQLFRMDGELTIPAETTGLRVLIGVAFGTTVENDKVYDIGLRETIAVDISDLNMIAPVLSEFKADTALVANDFRIINGDLYQITSPIANGGDITPGTNASRTTVGDVLKSLLNA